MNKVLDLHLLRSKIPLLVLCCAMGLIAALSWPITPVSGGLESHVVIEATGQRDPQGKSAEVWVTALPDGITASCLLAGSKDGWESRNGVLVSYHNQPDRLDCTAAADPKGSFRFTRHPWSGGAVITVNGQSRTLDLYSAKASGDALTLRLDEFPPGKPASASWLPGFLGAAAVASLLFFAGLMALQALPSSAVVPARELPFARRALWFALPSLAVFALVLAGTWPAQMSADSVVHWVNLHRFAFNNAAPVLPILLIGLPGYLAGTIGVSMIVQIILLAAAIGILCAEIEAWGGRRIAWTAAVVTPLLPPVALLSTVFWKDIPYTAFLAMLGALYFAALRSRGGAFGDRRFGVAMALALFAVAATRHNGVIASAVMLVATLLAFWRVMPRRTLIALVIGAVVAPVLWNTVLLPATGRVQPVPEYYKGMLAMHLLGAMAAADAPLPADTVDKMQAILPLSAWKDRYNCLNVGPLFFPADVNHKTLGPDLIPYAAAAALQHPVIAAGHFACMNALNWRLSPTPDSIGVPLGIPQELFASFPDLIVHEAPVAALHDALSGLFAWSYDSTWKTVIFWRPAALQLVLLALAGALVVQAGQWRAAALLMPMLANTASLLPLLSSQDFRYQYAMYVIGVPVLILLAALLARTKSQAPAAAARPAGRSRRSS